MSRFSSTRAGFLSSTALGLFLEHDQTLMLFLASTEKTSTHKGISLERYIQNIKRALSAPSPLFSAPPDSLALLQVMFFKAEKYPNIIFSHPPINSRLPLPVASFSQSPQQKALEWLYSFKAACLH